MVSAVKLRAPTIGGKAGGFSVASKAGLLCSPTTDLVIFLLSCSAHFFLTPGNFAVWGAMFSTFDCAFVGIRGKEDPWNAIASGALTSGVLSARYGLRVSLQSAVFGVSHRSRERTTHPSLTILLVIPSLTGLHPGLY